MSLVSAVITDIRTELDDGDSTRWTDAQILAVVKKALRRVDNIAVRFGLEFAKSSATVTVSSGESTTALPTDFKRDIGLYYNYEEIPKLDTSGFETKRSGSYWRINGSNIEIKEAVTDDTDLTLWYYPLTDYSAYTTASTMPWSGKLDDMVVNYAALLLKNTDEYSVETDMAIAKEIEQMILSVYMPLSATVQDRNGYSIS